jgi:hypothetical protein
MEVESFAILLLYVTYLTLTFNLNAHLLNGNKHDTHSTVFMSTSATQSLKQANYYQMNRFVSVIN